MSKQPHEVQALDVLYADGGWYVRRHYTTGDWLKGKPFKDPEAARWALKTAAMLHGLWVNDSGDWACKQEHAEAWAFCRWAGARIPNGPTAGMLKQAPSDLVRAVELILRAKAAGENILEGLFTSPQESATI